MQADVVYAPACLSLQAHSSPFSLLKTAHAENIVLSRSFDSTTPRVERPRPPLLSRFRGLRSVASTIVVN